jgi:hypothetical protein
MSGRTSVEERSLVDTGEATAWKAARDRLGTPERDRTYWLTTLLPDRRPHVRPLLGLWLDDAFYFVTGERTRKGMNLAADPRCAIATSSQELPALDVVLEGEARKVTDEAVVRRVAEAYGSAMHWPLEVRDAVVYGPNAPTAGPPPYAVWELRPTVVVGLPGIAGTAEGEGPAGAFSPTRWRFEAAGARDDDRT